MKILCRWVSGVSDDHSWTFHRDPESYELKSVLTILRVSRTPSSLLYCKSGNLFAILYSTTGSSTTTLLVEKTLSFFSLKHISRRHLARPCEKKTNPGTWRNEGRSYFILAPCRGDSIL
jgi:hypothetical protein